MGRGILMALLATVAYAVVDALSKYQAREYPVAILGTLVVGDFPDALPLVGIAVMVAGGLLVASRRRQAGK
jgi:LPXTG-motif cell wall-anchored protein